MIHLSDIGYYCSDHIVYEDNNGHYIEKGTITRFLIFLNSTEFLCTDWKNKIELEKKDLELIVRGGKYKIFDKNIELIYDPSNWTEQCEIINSETIVHHFQNPERSLQFKKWNLSTKNNTDEAEL